ncbi:metallophosphoesterase [Candidatus Liberibacter sp.]|uniref:metallophosphoesterase family protein n=1 Tax=Candidatus Liberibacter sp. TaxID=34022 RepID=UPI0015F50109|nr:metallophosphoesterase [Candidatus Liberibacter sp.]MBA5723677.1 metallophosphoesterase [Candidatus Liberibacter sp.]
MFILAHMSDIHLSCPPTITELSIKRLVGLANWHFNRKKHFSQTAVDLLVNDISTRNIDHLSITGDIVNLANNREVSAATHWLESIGNPHDISIIPGNHDAYASGSQMKSLHAWRNYITSDIPCTEKKLFPYLRIRNNIALIGCSTAIMTPPFTANGYFGPKQAEDTAKILRKANKDGIFRVVMMHHPPVLNTTSIYNRMFGIQRFKDMILCEGAELILHGHTHLNSLHWIQSPGGRTPVVGIASASHRIKTKKPQASYNLFYIARHGDYWNLRGARYTLSPDSTHVHEECSNIFPNEIFFKSQFPLSSFPDNTRLSSES